MKRVIITGGSGFLGHEFTKRMVDNYQVISAYHNNLIPTEGCEQIKLDITDYRDVMSLWRDFKPELVIHCAALVNVDEGEKDKSKIWAINATGTEHVAQACREFKSKLIYMSTDSVFDGTKGNYKETDTVNPINEYSKSKLKGEQVSTWAKDYLIIRMAFFDKLANWVLDNLKQNKSINMFRDVYFSGIYSGDLIGITLKMLEKQGIYHIGCQGSWSKFEFGVNLAKSFSLNPDLIRRTLVGDMKERAQRPERLSLDCAKVEKDLGIKMPTLTEGLKCFKESYGSCGN